MNQSNDFLNKLSTEIIKNHDIICIEDLNAKGMLRKLARRIYDVSWFGFVAKLYYKTDWYRREIIKIDKWFSSSQICSECGHICHTQHDRDINAGINLLIEGLRVKK